MTPNPQHLARGLAQAFRDIPSNAAWLRGRLTAALSANGGTALLGSRSLSATELESLTRADLLQLARRTEIPGRSRMSKQQLASRLAQQTVTTEDLDQAGLVRRTTNAERKWTR